MSQQPDRLIPILCRFRQDDDVWNAVCEDLPVAVFGETFEEAQENLKDALLAHLEVLAELGRIEGVIEELQRRAKDYGFLAPDDLAAYSPLVKFLVSVGAQHPTPSLALV